MKEKGAHVRVGTVGERIAERYLRSLGYSIIGRNVKLPIGELDLVAKDGHEFVFVEVKTMSGTGFGYPEQHVDRRKQRKLRQLAELTMRAYGQDQLYRIDVIAVTIGSTNEPLIHHIKHAVEG